MNGYYCLNCGEKLKQLSMNLSTDKYECPKCGTEWYKVRHIIVEWVEGEKEGKDELQRKTPRRKNTHH